MTEVADLVLGNFKDVSLGTIVAATIWMILTGRLVPRRTHEDALEAARTQSRAADEARAQVTALLEVGQVTKQVMGALPVPSAAEEVPQ